MFDDLFDLIDELEISLIIGFGSEITGKKRGISKLHDMDLILVSNYFKGISTAKRSQLTKKRLMHNYDLIILTIDEYELFKKEKNSIVNVALGEGEILYDRHGSNNK